MKPSVAPLFPSTKETTNYARLCRLLVDVGSQVLRDTFDAIHPPARLHSVLTGHLAHNVLRSLKNKILNPTQWGKLYPTVPSSVSSGDFDFRLLLVLLRNICGLLPPRTGWDSLPPAIDVSMEANIVRLKYYRNVVCGHADRASIDDATFNSYWQEISAAIVGLGGASYESAISELKKECMDPLIEVKIKEKIQDIQGIFTQKRHRSICKRPIDESLSCSPDDPPKKRKCPSEAMYVVKDGKPLDYELGELSQKLGDKWEELGARLGFNLAAIANFRGDNRRLSRRAYHMLMAWKQKEGSEATYTVLHNALCDKLVQLKLVAEQICCDRIVTELDELFAQLQLMHLDAGKDNDKTGLKIRLEKIASNKGFSMVDNEGSGNCMFYALSDQLEIAVGIKIKHYQLRQILIQYLRKNPKLQDGTDLFDFVHGYNSWDDYLKDIEQDGAWGDHVILCATANHYSTSIRVVSSLPRTHDVIIQPQYPVDKSKTLVLGHIHEIHYVSLRPIQG